MAGIDKVYVSELLKTGSNNVSTSMGPLNTLRAKVMATSFSKSSFFIEARGLSPNVLLGPYIELCQPIDVRFQRHGGAIVIPNGYCDVDSTEPVLAANAFAATSDQYARTSAQNIRIVDGVGIRPNGLIRALRSCVLTLNGTSFSTTCSQWIDIVEKLYTDGRVENSTGQAYNRAPYTGVGHPDHPLKQPGRYERCIQTIGADQIKGATYTAHVLTDVVFQFVIRSRLFLGPWVFSAFPGMGQALGDNFSGAVPYVNNLTIEGQYQDNPLIHMFQTNDNEAKSSVAVPVASLNGALGCGQAQNPVSGRMTIPPALTTDGTKQIDFGAMWASSIVDESGLKAGQNLGTKIAVRTPYLNLQWLEPDLTVMRLDPTYSFASKRFTCYEEQVQIKEEDATGSFAFQHVKIDRIAELYCIYVTDAHQDVGDAKGARQELFKGGAYDTGHKGSAYNNVFAPIDWSSLKISLSTKSNILGNMDAEKMGLTEISQYRKFLKYSQRANPMSFKQWRMSSQCILFSAEEVFLAFGSTYAQATLNISFKAYRQQHDTMIVKRDITSADDDGGSGMVGYGFKGLGRTGRDAKGLDRERNLTAHLVMIEPVVITLSQTACASQDVDFSNAEALQAYRQQESSVGAEVRDSSGVAQGLGGMAV